MVRSDWSKKWTDDPAKAKALAADPVFPGVSLDAIKFLQLKRHILFHGHEPLDTDSTPTLEGEAWLMHHGYAQAEGVANLDQVPETGALIAIGYPKLKGGTGGYARYIAICPPDWKYGISIGVSDAPLPKSNRLLGWIRYGLYRNATSLGDNPLGPAPRTLAAGRIPDTPRHKFINRLVVEP